MYPLAVIAVLAGSLLVGLLIWAVLRPNTRVQSALRRVPIKSLGSVEDGEWVRIVGTVRPAREPIVAPATRRAALAYETDAWYHSDTGGHVGPLHLARAVAFMIDDATGSAVVTTTEAVRLGLDPEGGDVRVPARDAPEPVLAGLEESVSDIRRDGDGTVGMSEGVLEPGERAAVAGIARVPANRSEHIVRLEPHPNHGILVSDAWATTQ